MNTSNCRRALLSLLTIGAMACAMPALARGAGAAQTQTAIPGNSIFQVAAPLQDQNGHAFKLADRRGQPTIVSMFYNSCQFVCPMLIDTVRSTEQQLSADERKQLSMLLITFDPARDDVKALKSIADKRELDPARWTLARTDAASVRKIAATLDIQYRLLGNGEFNHTTVLVLLDGEGRIVARTKKLGAVDPQFLANVKKALSASHAQGT